MLFILQQLYILSSVNCALLDKDRAELTIGYDSCQHEFYDYYYEEEEDGCYRTELNSTTPIEQRFGDGVKNCCGFHGYMVDGQCNRTEDVTVCHDPDHDGLTDDSIHQPLKYIKDCPFSIYVSGKLGNDEDVQNGVLRLKNFTSTEFCLGLECGDDGWEIKYRACIDQNSIR